MHWKMFVWSKNKTNYLEVLLPLTDCTNKKQGNTFGKESAHSLGRAGLGWAAVGKYLADD